MTQSAQDSCYSWRGVSQSIDMKGEKRGWSSDEDEHEPWWESCISQSTKKPTQKTSFQLSQPSSSQQTETSQSQQEKMATNRRMKQKKSAFI